MQLDAFPYLAVCVYFAHCSTPNLLWYPLTLKLALVGSHYSVNCLPSFPQVDLVWNFVGSIAGLLIVYILPPLYYLRIRFMHLRFRRQTGQSTLNVWCHNDSFGWIVKDVIAGAILCLGVVSMVAANYIAILGVIDAPSQRPQPPCRYWQNATITWNLTNITTGY